MSFMDKIAFWKKKDDFGPSEDYFNDLSNNPFHENQRQNNNFHEDFNSMNKRFENDDHFSNNQNLRPDLNVNQFNNKSFHEEEDDRNLRMDKPYEVKQRPSTQNNIGDVDLLNKNIEIISSKLDTLKAELDSMNQRLIGIENFSKKKEEPVRRYQW